MNRNRRYLRQHVRLYGGNGALFTRAVEAVDHAYILFSGHLPDNQLEKWEHPHHGEEHALEASARYLTPRSVSDIECELDEHVDPYPRRVLQNLMGNDFVYGPENKVDYLIRTYTDGVAR